MHSVKHNITRSTLRLVVLVLASFIALSCCGGGNSTGILPAQTKTATCAALPWCANLTPGTWYEVPNSHMSTVYYTCTNSLGCNGGTTPPAYNYTFAPEGTLQDIKAIEGPSAVMADWSSGALDNNRDRLYVAGGGHFGYYGNEVYSFDLRSLTWSLLKNPDLLAYGWYCPDPAVGPCSAHYYGMIQFSPATDALVLPGRLNRHWHDPSLPSNDIKPIYPNFYTAGSGVYLLGNLSTSPSYSVSTAYTPSSPSGSPIDAGYESYEGAISGFDPTTNLYWLHTTFHGRLSSFNPSTGVWTGYGGNTVSNSYQYSTYLIDGSCTGALDPVDHLFVAIGGSGSSNPCLPAITVPTASFLAVWDISAASQAIGHIKAVAQFSTGANTAEHSNITGFEWDSAINRFVAWTGGQSVYILDPTTWTWFVYPAAGATPNVPTPAGTFGRFRYDPNLDVFVLATSTTSDVFILKLDNSVIVNPNCNTPLPTITNETLTLTTDSYKKMNYQITASNTPNYFWGNGLPSGYGVSIDPVTGILSGTPTKAGTYHALIGAQNACGTGPGTALTIVVSDTPHFHNGANSYVTLQQAVNAATAGDTITVDAGNYMDMYVDITKSLTIQPVGAALSAVFGSDQLIPFSTGSFDSNNATTYRKGMFLTEDGTTTVLNGLEIYGARNDTGDGENASAVRYQGGDFTLINSYIHNNQNGFLGGQYPSGTVTITNSVFDQNGRCEPPNSCAHGAYIGEVAQATIANSTFTNTHIGHHIKSRALNTSISNTIEDDGSSNPGASLEIDLPDGGISTITCNVAIKNQYADNQYLVEFGEESATNGLNPNSSLSVTDSLFVNNFGAIINNRHINGIVNTLAGVDAYVGNDTFVSFDTGYTTTGAGTFTLSGNTYTNTNPGPLESCGLIGANLSIQVK